MKQSVSLYLLPAFLLLALFQSAKATTVVMLSDTEMALDSQIIITGEVHSVVSAWDDSRQMIWTYVEIERDLLIKGNLLESKIVLKQEGGEVWPYGIEIFGQPKFIPGQKVLLYLKSAPDGSLHVMHSFMGMFSIVEDESIGGFNIERTIDMEKIDMRPRSDNEPVTNRARLENYLAKLRSTMQREAIEIARIESERASLPLHAVPAEYESKKQSSEGFSPAYAFMSDGVRWMEADSDEPIKFYINTSNSPVPGGGQRELIRAMEAWSYQSSAAIWIVPYGQTSKCGLDIDNQNVISFGDCRKQLDSPANCAGVLARTQVAFNTTDSKMVNGKMFKRIIDADIVFNDGMDCFLTNPVTLSEVASHELGHAIGLGHSTSLDSIMRSYMYGDGRGATLSSDDKSGSLMIYPDKGQSREPEITDVKVKNGKKLTIYGQNFTANSMLLINGRMVKPNAFTADRQLSYKGKLNASGTNELYVVNNSGKSSLFQF
jgi:hypothetical protein